MRTARSDHLRRCTSLDPQDFAARIWTRQHLPDQVLRQVAAPGGAHDLRATLTIDGDELLVATTDGLVRLPAFAIRSVERLDLAAALLRSCLTVRA